ncbi:MAG TPA: lytic transglycosylase domain-containing protein [Nocardioidaceae bacterium]|nr:lytic transglycosylase domain-containing protein [Nocardioidaceae bacterium]
MFTKGSADDRRARLAGWQKAMAIVPLALLTGSLTSAVGSPPDEPDSLGDDSTASVVAPVVPTTPFEEPASVQLTDSFPTGVDPHAGPDGTVSTISSNGIPTAALIAYQRAATVLAEADPSCRLEWPLIGAIGRVESDHGRANGNVLGSDGLARPGIYGVPLNGQGGTASISDSDNGVYDNDPAWDRAVGPMQFIPTTWQVVAVDGDNDGAKNPQDIDDAALATAVYLCAGEGDLSTDSGARTAIYRYNHSTDYVNLVMSIAEAYAMGDYSMVPNGTTTPTVLTDLDHDAQQQDGDQTSGPFNGPPDSHGNQGDDDPSGGDDNGGSDGPSDNNGGGDNGGDNDGGGDNGGDGGSDGGDNSGGLQDVPGDVSDGVGDTVNVLNTLAEATKWCQRQLADENGITQADIGTCADAVVGQTVTEAADTLSGLLDSLLGDVVCGLLGCQREGD